MVAINIGPEGYQFSSKHCFSYIPLALIYTVSITVELLLIQHRALSDKGRTVHRTDRKLKLRSRDMLLEQRRQFCLARGFRVHQGSQVTQAEPEPLIWFCHLQSFSPLLLVSSGHLLRSPVSLCSNWGSLIQGVPAFPRLHLQSRHDACVI